VASRTGALSWAESMLEQADLPLRAGEALFYLTVFSAMAFVLSLLLWDPFTALVVLGVAIGGPIGYVTYKRNARLKEFERQLPDTLQLLAGALRAGFSFTQAMETIANESHGAMRQELQRAFTEARLGRPIEESLNETATRMKSRDLEWAVLA